MAINKNSILLYGAAGVILALAVIAFIPARTETHVTTGVNMDIIPGYGLQFVKISEDTTQINHLLLHIQSVEAQMPSGEWLTISSEDTQWDMWRETETIIILDKTVSGYTQIRLNLSTDSKVTLADGTAIQLGIPSFPVDMTIEPDYNEWTGLRLEQSQGTMSSYMLPNMQIELSTVKLTAEIVPQ